MKNPNFLIIDSGVGGLSIWQEIQQLIPNSHTCYVADNGAYPYGTLEEQVLVQRLMQLLPELEQQYQPDIIVIACNTASTVVLEPLRAQTNTPVIGVVPAIKPAAALSESKQEDRDQEHHDDKHEDADDGRDYVQGTRADQHQLESIFSCQPASQP